MQSEVPTRWGDCPGMLVPSTVLVIQGCYGDDDIVLSILELKLELKVSGWWTGLLGTDIVRLTSRK